MAVKFQMIREALDALKINLSHEYSVFASNFKVAEAITFEKGVLESIIFKMLIKRHLIFCS